MLAGGCYYVQVNIRQTQTSYLKPDGGWLSAWETATSYNKRTLLLSANALAAWAEMASKARKGSRVLSKTTQVPKAVPA